MTGKEDIMEYVVGTNKGIISNSPLKPGLSGKSLNLPK